MDTHTATTPVCGNIVNLKKYKAMDLKLYIANMIVGKFMSMYYETTTFIQIADVLNELYDEYEFDATQHGEKLLLVVEDEYQPHKIELYDRDDKVREYMIDFIVNYNEQLAEQFFNHDFVTECPSDDINEVLDIELSYFCEEVFDDFVEYLYEQEIKYKIE